MNDLKKVGVTYLDIDLPGPESYLTSLETTPVFFAKKLDDIMRQPDLITSLHEGIFKWSKIQVVPNIDNAVSPGEVLRIAYCILGAKSKAEPGQQAKNDIECVYEVHGEDGEVAIRLIVHDIHMAGIDQLLPLKQTVLIKDDKGERQEQRNLIPGKYSLVVKVKDKLSGATVEKKVPFEVK